MLADEMPPADWHWDHISLDELRDALRAQYPRQQLDDAELETVVLTLWARIIAKRVGLRVETGYRRGY